MRRRRDSEEAREYFRKISNFSTLSTSPPVSFVPQIIPLLSDPSDSCSFGVGSLISFCMVERFKKKKKKKIKKKKVKK